MTEQPAPLQPRNLDSQTLRRLALRIQAEADYLVDAIRQDNAGDVPSKAAHQLLEDSIAHLVEIIRDLLPLQRMAVNAYVAERTWSAQQ